MNDTNHGLKSTLYRVVNVAMGQCTTSKNGACIYVCKQWQRNPRFEENALDLGRLTN